MRLLEDCPLFNAGHGSVFTSAATHELDAAIMDGATLRSGAIANVHRVRNPIFAARKVMENSKHVFFVGEGAEDFARQEGLELVDPSYFSTEARREQLLRVQRETPEAAVLDHDGQAMVARGQPAPADPLDADKKFGTVGAVAVDAQGNLAAATSTGGITNKQIGRVGDAPLIGAGTYASNKTCAVSATGTGEMFIRMVAAYDVAAQMEYAGASLAQAADSVVMDKLPTIEGKGGLVAWTRRATWPCRSTPKACTAVMAGWAKRPSWPFIAKARGVPWGGRLAQVYTAVRPPGGGIFEFWGLKKDG